MGHITKLLHRGLLVALKVDSIASSIKKSTRKKYSNSSYYYKQSYFKKGMNMNSQFFSPYEKCKIFLMITCKLGSLSGIIVKNSNVEAYSNVQVTIAYRG